jgi:hypothetical protein
LAADAPTRENTAIETRETALMNPRHLIDFEAIDLTHDEAELGHPVENRPLKKTRL